MSTEKQNPFAIVPWQVAADGRLTKRHLKVLIALLSFRSHTTAPFWATREQISRRCGLDAQRVSVVTTELQTLGVLAKHGSGRQAVRYEFLGCNEPDNRYQNSNGYQNSNRYQNSNANRYQIGNTLRPTETHTSSYEEESSAAPNDAVIAKQSNCPAQAIVAEYHRLLPELPAVAKLTDKRRKWLQTRWREDTRHQSIEFWMEFFEHVRHSPFLLGDNDRAWTADFEWLVNKSNFYKTIEGKYHHAAA